MRVTRVLGLLHSREESAYVLSRLKPTIDEELHQHGFTNLGLSGLGPDVLFTRAPVRSLADLRRQKLWVWDLDTVLIGQLPALGLDFLPLPIEEAGHSFDARGVDGFIALPTAALAFQWSTQARYVIELRLSFLSGCLLLSDRAYDALPVSGQSALHAAAAKLEAQLEDLGREQDHALLDGLFVHQGLVQLPVSEAFRAEFVDAASRAREKLADGLIPNGVLLRVTSWLADFRAQGAPPPARHR